MSDATPLSAAFTNNEGFDEKTLQAVLIKAKPSASRAEAARYAALIVAVARELDRRPKLAPAFIAGPQFAHALTTAVDMATGAQPGSVQASKAEPTGKPGGRPVEVSCGEGLGKVLSPDEAEAQMARIITHPPVESWAGPLLGAVQIEKQLKIPQSTLALWHATNAVIGIQRGIRRHEYPLEQFIDGRPLLGIAKLVAVTPSPRAAWMWLRQAHGAFDGETPLRMLEKGKPDEVLKIAHRDFDTARD